MNGIIYSIVSAPQRRPSGNLATSASHSTLKWGNMRRPRCFTPKEWQGFVTDTFSLIPTNRLMPLYIHLLTHLCINNSFWQWDWIGVYVFHDLVLLISPLNSFLLKAQTVLIKYNKCQPIDNIFDIFFKHGNQILSIDTLRSHVSRGTYCEQVNWHLTLSSLQKSCCFALER